MDPSVNQGRTRSLQCVSPYVDALRPGLLVLAFAVSLRAPNAEQPLIAFRILVQEQVEGTAIGDVALRKILQLNW